MSDPRTTPWDVKGWSPQEVGELTPAVVRLAMTVDPGGFIGVRVRDVAALVDMFDRAQTEVTRLRSDEWLEKAAEEIDTSIDDGIVGTRLPDTTYIEGISAIEFILRKHRDGIK